MKLLLLVGLLSAVPTPAGTLSENELQRLFREAGTLFRQANQISISDPAAGRDLHQRAVLRFERIVREGRVRNGKLYYNLGNAYFLAGDVGRAILNYRRAERYAPQDANLRQNLAYARRSRADRFEERQKTRVLKTLLFWHYDLPAAARAKLFVILWVVLWLAAAVRLLNRRVPGAVTLAAGCMTALLFASLLVEAAVSGRRQAGVILVQEVVARKGDGESYQPSFREPLHAGAEFVLRESRNGWYYIELPDGRSAWIPAAAAGLVNDIETSAGGLPSLQKRPEE